MTALSARSWALAIVCGLCLALLAPNAQATPTDGPTVVILGSVDPQLLGRFRGYLAGSAWRTVDIKASPASSVEALRIAQAQDAAAVFWTQKTSSERIDLRIVDVLSKTITVRSLPLGDGSDPFARSAAYETSALILYSTLQSIEQGDSVGEALAEPVAEKPVRQAPTPPPHQPQQQPENPLSLRLEVEWQASLNDALLSHGPRLSVGATSNSWWFVGTGRLALPRTVNAVADQVEVAFRLQELSLGLAAGYHWKLGAAWGAEAGVAANLAIIQRERVAAGEGIAPEPEHRTLAPEASLLFAVHTPRWGQYGPALVLHGGAAVFLRRPRWLLDESTETDARWAPVQPWLATGMRFDFR